MANRGVSGVKDSEMNWNRQPYGVNLCASGYNDYKSSLIDALAKVLKEDDDSKQVNKPSVDKEMTEEELKSYQAKAKEKIDAAIKAQSEAAANGMDAPSNVSTHILECQTVSDSSIFGNDVLNPYSGFCRDDDIIPKEFTKDGKHNYGMGRVYKEIYDSKQQVVYLQFGIPKYRNLYHFLANASDADTSDLNDYGDTSILSKVANFFIDMAKFAIELPFMPFEFAHYLYESMRDDKITEYFYFREQMYVYYNYVNSILIHLATGIGLFDGNKSVVANLKKFDMPKILCNDDGDPRPDIYSILSTRSKRFGAEEVSHNLQKVGEELSKKFPSSQADPETKDAIDKKTGQKVEITDKGISGTATVNGQEVIVSKDKSLIDENGNLNQEKIREVAKATAAASYDGFWDKTWGDIKSVVRKIWDGYQASALDNTKWVAFRIEKDSDNASESFSNGLSDSSLQQTLNGFASNNRNMNLDAASMGTGIIGLVDRWINKAKGITQAIGNVVSSAQNGGALASIIGYLHSGNGYYDLPQQWSNSSFTRSVSINIRLRSRTGGDPLSVYTNIMVPFACILAGAMPRANGDSTYTSPFILRAYCRGMFSIPAGMITSLNITRGDSEFGWSIWRLPTTMSLNIQITDLSPVLFMGLQGGQAGPAAIWKRFKQAFANNTKEHEYLDTLSGLGLKQRIYYSQNVRRKLMELGATLRSQYGNPTWWGMMIADTPVARIVNAFRTAGSMNVPNN